MFKPIGLDRTSETEVTKLMSDFTSHKLILSEFLNQFKILKQTQNSEVLTQEMQALLLKQIKDQVARSEDFKVFHAVAPLPPLLRDHK